MASYQSANMLPLTPRKLASESLPGYVCRLSETNGLAKQEWLPLTPVRRSAISFAHCVAMDSEALAALEKISGTAVGSLVHEQWHLLDSAAGPYIGQWGEALPIDALMLSSAQVCPICLADANPFLHADWDYSLVAVCTLHRCRLIDECHACRAALRWSRPRMAACGNCAADLRDAPASNCSEADCIVADFAAAVARFNFVGDVESLETPESLFELGRLLSLGREEFLTKREQRHFSRMPVAHRFSAAQRLANCIVQRNVIGTLIHRHLLGHIEHIRVILGESRARSRLARFLSCNEFLNVPMCRYLAYAGQGEEPLRAVELYQGRPPRLLVEAEALEFVGCSKEEFELAVADGFVSHPTSGMAYDLDELLELRRRFAALLSERNVDESLGIPGLCNALLRLRVLRSERRCSLPVAISEQHYETVLDRLMQARSSPSENEVNTVILGDVAPEVNADSLASLIVLVLNGGVTSFEWAPPWGWKQMSVDVETWEQVSRE